MPDRSPFLRPPHRRPPMLATALPLLLALQSTEGGPPADQPGFSLWPMLIGMVAIFYFVAIRPERKERQRKQQMIEAIKKNDRVLTTSGMYASVAAVGENDLTIKFDDGPTRVRVLKSAIATVIDKDGEAQAEG